MNYIERMIVLVLYAIAKKVLCECEDEFICSFCARQTDEAKAIDFLRRVAEHADSNDCNVGTLKTHKHWKCEGCGTEFTLEDN